MELKIDMDPMVMSEVVAQMMEKYPAEFDPEEHDVSARLSSGPFRINLSDEVVVILEKVERLHSHEMGMLI